MSRTIRVHTRQALSVGAEIRLEAGPAHHLVRVLRRRPGDEVVLFNGDGAEYPGRIVEARTPDTCRVALDTARWPAVESPLSVTLLQAIARGDRMDWCIQKACELGVSAIVPVFTERTEVRLSGARAEKRLHHWQAVAVAACEQSGRCRIPDIARPVEWTAIQTNRSVALVLDPDATLTPATLAPTDPPAFTLAIGPEGGWTDAERADLAKRGFAGVRLGPRVLRTETAGPAMIAALQALYGDWR